VAIKAGLNRPEQPVIDHCCDPRPKAHQSTRPCPTACARQRARKRREPSVPCELLPGF
jgi:hypothetical protein